ncbi:DNA replication/repair protein RecF [Bosea sp. (in: a-proteobacteria)]|uniref:DNA replication/repair protein RecF n=1 Tax=Bosea sp. (in: a-proteobacteria) TaxID=1871050 RepID=UPI002613562A|nr:DNA replication/repair protein RecF [Bosea sp. (in: a-proteobacteria)]MCO5090384.1 DNA replication/repair protein RecF [Bosea sp. (in: a-proteobacteria)]
MAAVARLILQDFRSYETLDLPVGGQIVALVGENGAGKTNILEALSLFTPGRGLRRAELTAMARQGGGGAFAASVTLAEEAGRLGFGLGPADPEGRRPRLARIDGASVGSALAFSDHLRVVWLTPDLDGLFRGAAGERRRFLDRLVLAIDPGHATRSNALERALRSRNRILEESPGQGQWLDAVEREVAELGVAVAAARAETVARLSAIIAETRDDASPFPHALITLVGEIDGLVARLPALDAEDAYRGLLRQGRNRDRAAGRTLAGPQASDLEVRHGLKHIPAGQGSTGEQKALLIGLVLAHARLVAAMSGIAPLVLLDEIAAHLDPRRRAALYEGLTGLGCQIWMTGADAALFADLPMGAERVRVEPGRAVVE